ncbi:MAG: gliding motility-associated C-terminal domain-containing protein, partial [Ferruginibacter sp.]
ICCLLSSLSLKSQSVTSEWIHQIGNESYDGGRDLVTDAAGNVFVTGFFSRTVDFDPGSGVFNMTSPPNNEEDVFVAKYDRDGNFVWAKQFSGSFLDVPNSMTIDATGNLFLTGVFFGTTDFNPGLAVFNLISAGNEDAYIVKLNSSGNFVWAKRLGSTLFDRGNAISVDANGDVYVGGYFRLTVDFDPNAGVAELTSEGEEDAFVLKLSNNGNFLWAKQIGGSLFQGVTSLKVGAAGFVYVTGYFLGTTDFDPSLSVFEVTATGADFNSYVLKLDISGNFIWSKTLSSSTNVQAFDLELDHEENIYCIGTFNNAVTIDPLGSNVSINAQGLVNALVFKMNSNGALLWAKNFGGSSFVNGVHLTVDPQQQVYIAGTFAETMDVDPGTAVMNFTSAGSLDIFIAKLSAVGNYIFGFGLGGTGFDGPQSIFLDSQKNIFITGNFLSLASFDPYSGGIQLTSRGESDAFLQKFSQCEAISTTTINAVTCKSYSLNGQTYSSSGIYTQILKNDVGCDSIITIQLSITRLKTEIDVTICSGEIYEAGGAFQTTTGIYTDTLQNILGCDSLVLTKLNVLSSPQPDLGADRNICSGTSTLLNAGVFNNYVWSNGAVSTTISINSAGLYWVRVMGFNGCVSSDSLFVPRLVSVPSQLLPTELQLCEGDVIELSVPGYNRYVWSTGDSTAFINVRTAGIYAVKVFTVEGCEGSDSKPVLLLKNCIPFNIPSAFTPNNDGLNDIFRPMIQQEITEYRFVVFNRWGQQIFVTSQRNRG